MKELAYVNGVFSPIDEAKVSIEDRGFQFADAVYEVVAVYNGRPFLLDAHLRRLEGSLEAIHLDFDLKARPLRPTILEGLRRAGTNGDAMVYIQISRGVQPRSHVIAPDLEPTVVMTFKPLPEVPRHLRERGARIMTTPDIRWANCYVKATALLPNVLVRNDAIHRGYDDALFVSDTGEVRECTAANVFLLRGNNLITPPRTESVLHGVTQAFLMQCATAIGLTAQEQTVTVADLLAAEELFMSATTVEVLGITSVDDKPIADGRVGDVTRRLYDEFRARTRGQVKLQSVAI